MSRILVLSVIVASLSTIVGCGASATRHSATPATVNVADVRDEACWTPPEEVAMHIQETTKEPEAATPSEKKLEGSYRPNRQERPVVGAVHAATY
ncbi:MAG: hypothetical protein JWO86_5744 [Myxococcaceae bacterium]|jgi:hypothetical protein|nr:hypothetical protein [Myxococcaceae bacterium]MEA2753307.1 hypothetical protein [Myxococcales bacterium]